MIKLERPKKPSGFEKDPEIVAARGAIATIVSSGEAPESKAFADVWKKFKPAFLEAQYQGKCAFCETRFLAAYYGDVEHYRPKAMVKEAAKPGTRRDAPREDRKRTWKSEEPWGYWWLAYAWDNWLASCKVCNSSWKGNQFPLFSGTRGAMVEGAEGSEEPALINPFDVDPWNHIDFKPDGDVVGLTLEGKATVEVVGLDRWSLVDERRGIAERLLDVMADYVEAVTIDNQKLIRRVLRDVAGYCAESAPYAGMCRWLVDESPLLGGLRWTEVRDWVAQNP